MALLRDVKSELGSAYLLDHADNPVQWRTWGNDALEEAKRLGRPIFLSVGYAACHWCHVMAHESFEDDAIAEILNAHFVPVKVDREERPDVDALYMAATQLVTGRGGWPMSVFLLPDGRPFTAGTYFPPTDRAGQMGFGRLLLAITDAWRRQRPLVERQADELSAALVREVRFIDYLAPRTESIDLGAARTKLRDELLVRADRDGGFGDAPKFPRPSYVEALLDFDDDSSRRAVERTLESMSRLGLYDHFGGGFARYSVDASWHVPHFEKMLSDQALLARCYLRASRVAGRGAWRDVALDTLRFVLRDLAVAQGYASSLDADAGGVEGSHVTWTLDEVEAVLRTAGLASDLDQVLARWRIGAPGEFEGRSIPRLAEGQPFTVPPSLRRAHAALVASRRARVQPSRDEKIVLEWNAMLAGALLDSGEATFEARGLEVLAALARTHHDGASWFRTQGHQAVATASDVAWLIDARLDAFELTGDDAWLTGARELADYLVDHYWDGPVPSVQTPDRGGGLFTQSDTVGDLLTRPKEIFDGATPSAHAVATRALARLGLISGDLDALATAQRLVQLAGTLLTTTPSACPDLVAAAGFALEGVEVVIPGPPSTLARHVRSMAVPRTVLITGSGASPLLADRRAGLAYVCRGGVCAAPVADVAALDALVREATWPS